MFNGRSFYEASLILIIQNSMKDVCYCLTTYFEFVIFTKWFSDLNGNSNFIHDHLIALNFIAD